VHRDEWTKELPAIAERGVVVSREAHAVR
jgi:hypothetical protein